MEQSTLFSIKSLCRTCTTDTTVGDAFKVNAICIFEHINESPGSPTVMDLLIKLQPEICIGFQDNLPKTVCMACIEQLQKIYEFLEAYKQANSKLLKLLNGIDLEETVMFDSAKNESEKMAFEDNVDEEPISTCTLNNMLDIIVTPPVGNISNQHDDVKVEKMIGTESENSDGGNNDLNEGNDLLMEMEPSSIVDSHCNKKENKPLRKKGTRKNSKMKNKKGCTGNTAANKEKDTSSNQKEETKASYEFYFKQHQYKDHLRTHSDEKPFLCPECGKGFKIRTCLTAHMKRHTGVKSVVCPVCPKTFVDKSGLHSHMFVHKKEKPFVCDTCGAAFNMAYLLKRHSFLHTGIKNYACTHCDQRFARSRTLHRHMLTHTGEKPFECHYCDRAFSQSNDCHTHMKSHVGPNIHLCELCPMRFPFVRELRAHFDTHKSDDEEKRAKNLEERRQEVNNLKINFGYKKD
ncbi:zinc finger protein 567-like [Musca vetustissima]|uniref:zinc finger protein 567-like n=1 Tax=Musca vetustissima TaxID=27455 RepID=UPI002AB7D440|nr:zinc finger protein 567-like [Musca vetustissima]